MFMTRHSGQNILKLTQFNIDKVVMKIVLVIVKYDYYLAASGTEEAPSSMVSSEAESEGSVLSEARHDNEAAALVSDPATEQAGTLHEKPLPVINDWRSVGTTVGVGVGVAPYVASRGRFPSIFLL